MTADARPTFTYESAPSTGRASCIRLPGACRLPDWAFSSEFWLYSLGLTQEAEPFSIAHPFEGSGSRDLAIYRLVRATQLSAVGSLVDSLLA